MEQLLVNRVKWENQGFSPEVIETSLRLMVPFIRAGQVIEELERKEKEKRSRSVKNEY